jgi:hypothetical protein
MSFLRIRAELKPSLTMLVLSLAGAALLATWFCLPAQAAGFIWPRLPVQVLAIPYLMLFIGCAAAVAEVFTHDLRSREFVTALAQPVNRSTLWNEKLAASALLILPVVLAETLANRVAMFNHYPFLYITNYMHTTTVVGAALILSVVPLTAVYVRASFVTLLISVSLVTVMLGLRHALVWDEYYSKPTRALEGLSIILVVPFFMFCYGFSRAELDTLEVHA